MISLFAIAPNDQSLLFLSGIFGSMEGVLPVTGTDQANLLGTMFKYFNSMVLAVAALMVVYITVVGVMKTAHEGEPMGREWNSLWIPIRVVLGIASIVPTPSGYCGLQIVMMWVIVQGIGAADVIWSKALGVVQNGSAYGGLTQNQTPQLGVKQTITQLFQGLVCQATTRRGDGPLPGQTGGTYYCANNKTPYCTESLPAFDKNATSYSLGPNGNCGTLTYCNVTEACDQSKPGFSAVVCAGCQGQVAGLATIIPLLTTIAGQVAEMDYGYRAFYYTPYNPSNQVPPVIKSYCQAKQLTGGKCCVPPKVDIFHSSQCNPDIASRDNFPVPDSGNGPENAGDQANTLYWQYGLGPNVNYINFLQANVGTYILSISDMVQPVIQQMNSQTQLQGRYDEANKNGWLYAGAYYYIIAKKNDQNVNASLPDLTFSGGPQSGSSGPLTGIRNNFDAAGKLIASAAMGAPGSNLSTGGGNVPAQMSSISTQFSSVGGDIMSSFIGTISGNKQGSAQVTTDPLAKIQIFGRTLLIIVEVLFFVLIGVVFVLAVLLNINPLVFGNGLSTPPAGEALLTISIWLVPVVLGFMGLFAAYGGTLAVYVPLIPYILFIFGGIGWFILTIEAMVAAPIVALGIISPSGHHVILSKAEPALMMLFGIFLRPSLMIFGMFAGMLLSVVAVTMINMTFASVMGDVVNMSFDKGVPSQTPSLLELIFFIGAYIGLCVAALNKCFAMIHIIPDRTLQWIGGHPGHGGEQEALGAAKEGVTGAAGGAQQVGQAGAGRVQAGMETGMKKREEGGKAAAEAEAEEQKKAAATKGKTPPET